MRESQGGAGQQHAPAAKAFLEQAVVPALAVGGVADDRVGDVFEVAANLMTAAGFGREFEQGVAAGGVAVDGEGQFHGGKAAIAGERGLGFGRGVGSAELVVVVLPRQRVVDGANLVRVAAHDGEVGLVDLLRLELLAELAGDVAVEGEEQHAGGAAIEPMGRVNVLADLVAHDLHGEARFVAVEFAAVDEQARGLVHGDQRFVAVEDRQCFPHAGNSPST